MKPLPGHEEKDYYDTIIKVGLSLYNIEFSEMKMSLILGGKV